MKFSFSDTYDLLTRSRAEASRSDQSEQVLRDAHADLGTDVMRDICAVLDANRERMEALVMPPTFLLGLMLIDCMSMFHIASVHGLDRPREVSLDEVRARLLDVQRLHEMHGCPADRALLQQAASALAYRALVHPERFEER